MLLDHINKQLEANLRYAAASTGRIISKIEQKDFEDILRS